jgi:general secretion pathway protein D
MRNITLSILLLLLAGCAEIIPEPYEPSTGHINTRTGVDQSGIPELVQQAPVLPEPEPPVELEKYTVVVNAVPVNELLFALARDAQINVDIDPAIQGVVTLNAVDQTLPQLLNRISRQVNIRYEFDQDNLIISPDTAFFRAYKIDYLNMVRDTTTSISTDTGVGSDGGGAKGNTSLAEVKSTGSNKFWVTLVQNIMAIIGEETAGGDTTKLGSGNVIPHPETGILTVNATSRQHVLIQNLIDNAIANGNRQVLLQATIVEVRLNDDFQAGIDWSFINNGKAGFDVVSAATTGVPVNTVSSLLLKYVDPNPTRDQVISASLQLLEEFGDVSVLSSPQIMALNNQTAILKVVDNIVYFEVDVEPGVANSQGSGEPAVDTTAKTVPVGIVMSMTPQINENDSIILQVRPTISRILSFVNDPNPELAKQNVQNPVPQIQTREMESVLRMNNGQIAVLGGLMQDESNSLDAATPGLSKIPLIGEAFKSRQRQFKKTELVIFLRPIVVRTPSIDTDLGIYKALLEKSTRQRTVTEGKLR